MSFFPPRPKLSLRGKKPADAPSGDERTHNASPGRAQRYPLGVSSVRLTIPTTSRVLIFSYPFISAARSSAWAGGSPDATAMSVVLSGQDH